MVSYRSKPGVSKTGVEWPGFLSSLMAGTVFIGDSCVKRMVGNQKINVRHLHHDQKANCEVLTLQSV